MKMVEKMTKKERKAYYSKYRNTWGMSPVTRKPSRNKGKELKMREKEKSAREGF